MYSLLRAGDDDASGLFPVLQHARYESVRAVDDAEQVHVDDLAPRLDIVAIALCRQTDAGVEMQEIDCGCVRDCKALRAERADAPRPNFSIDLLYRVTMSARTLYDGQAIFSCAIVRAHLTSVGTARTSIPARLPFALSRAASSRSAKTSFIPCSPSLRAIASPMPEALPVSTATFPALILRRTVSSACSQRRREPYEG